jgi:hypothetical protein
MADQSASSAAGVFTAPEREFIRRELGQYFSSYPSVAEGLFLRTWRAGPQAGEPKVPSAVQSMRARGLVEIRIVRPRMPRAFFTEAGLAALRQLASDRRALDPVRYAHVRRELGLQTDEAQP